jgi:hypothetical protein
MGWATGGARLIKTVLSVARPFTRGHEARQRRVSLEKSPSVAERSQFRQPLHLHRVVRQQAERHDRTGQLMELNLLGIGKILE